MQCEDAVLQCEDSTQSYTAAISANRKRLQLLGASSILMFLLTGAISSYALLEHLNVTQVT